MSKVAIVTDSTAGFPENILEDLSIRAIPLQVIWGDTTYQDSIDIQPTEFYTKLETATVMPSTSQPSPAAFKKVYAELAEAGHDILSIHISSELSGTMASALQARDMLPDATIEIIDSGTTSLAMGLPTLIAARAAKDGASLEECKQIATQAQANSGIYFAVATLEFLKRGGRIGGAAAFLGTMLNLKPILSVQEKKIEAVERVRSMSKAINRLIEIVEQQAGDSKKVHVGVIHANAPDEANKLLERLRDRLNVSDSAICMIGEVSPVIGTHTGPGTVGLAYSYE
jgi:DegV family protein with EDD domain